MTHNDYGCRYPGGRSVIDSGFVRDEETMPKGTKPSDTSWRPPKGQLAVKPVKYLELKIGDRVKHRVAGEGTVADLSDGKVYVAFDRRKGKPQMLKKSTAEKKLKVIVFAGTSK